MMNEIVSKSSEHCFYFGKSPIHDVPGRTITVRYPRMLAPRRHCYQKSCSISSFMKMLPSLPNTKQHVPNKIKL